MAVFALENGRLVPAHSVNAVNSGVAEESLAAIRERVLDLIDASLFPVAWQSEPVAEGQDGRRESLICLDAAGQTVTVEVLSLLDPNELLGALARAGRHGEMSRSSLALIYGQGARTFPRDWRTFLDACPPGAAPGPRLYLIVLEIDPGVRSAVDALVGAGLDVRLATLHDGGSQVFVSFEEVRTQGSRLGSILGAGVNFDMSEIAASMPGGEEQDPASVGVDYDVVPVDDSIVGEAFADTSKSNPTAAAMAETAETPAEAFDVEETAEEPVVDESDATVPMSPEAGRQETGDDEPESAESAAETDDEPVVQTDDDGDLDDRAPTDESEDTVVAEESPEVLEDSDADDASLNNDGAPPSDEDTVSGEDPVSDEAAVSGEPVTSSASSASSAPSASAPSGSSPEQAAQSAASIPSAPTPSAPTQPSADEEDDADEADDAAQSQTARGFRLADVPVVPPADSADSALTADEAALDEGDLEGLAASAAPATSPQAPLRRRADARQEGMRTRTLRDMLLGSDDQKQSGQQKDPAPREKDAMESGPERPVRLDAPHAPRHSAQSAPTSGDAGNPLAKIDGYEGPSAFAQSAMEREQSRRRAEQLLWESSAPRNEEVGRRARLISESNAATFSSEAVAEAAEEDMASPAGRLIAIAQRYGAPFTVVWRQRRRNINVKARVTPWGTIVLSDGRVFTDPTVAARKASGMESVDGWRVWRIPGGKRLGDL
ncbi:hypothetical protein VR010_06410 [Actinomycetaceae bacterium L2_0104]